jgi:trehalose 6-phosphate phosphatase
MPSRPFSLPAPLPSGLLVKLARERSLLLCLDYDGTLAELTTDPAKAYPYPGVAEQLQRLASTQSALRVAIVTGRRITEVKTFLGGGSGLCFSGVHGLEIDEPWAPSRFAPEVTACAGELRLVREWLRKEVPDNLGFRIEDKQAAVGLHYRLADPDEAQILCARFARLITEQTPRLQLLQLKMLVEALPRAASKAHALTGLRQLTPHASLTAYLGDDSTDEDAFEALGQQDVGILVGRARLTLARYHLEGPAAVARELAYLADSLK